MDAIADRTVSVRLRMTVQDFMRNGAAASAAVKRLSGQLDELDRKRVQPKIDIDVDKNRISQAVASMGGTARKESRKQSPGIFKAMFTPNRAVLQALRTGIPAALSSPIGLAVGAAIVGAVSSTVAAAVSAGLIGGVGAAFTTVAAIALRENERVRESFDSMTDTVKADLVEAAQPLVPVFDQALGRVEQMFGPRIADPLEDIFTGLGPTIVPFVESAVDTVGNVLDSLATPEFIEGMQTVLGEITDEMPRLGQSVGDALVTLAENGDDIAEAFGTVVTVLDAMLDSGIATINFLTDGLNTISEVTGPVVEGFQKVDFWLKKISGTEGRDTGPLAAFQEMGDDLRKLGVPDWLLFTDATKGAGDAAGQAGNKVQKLASDARHSGDSALTAAAQLEDYKERAEELANGLRLMSGLRRDSIRAGLDAQQVAADASRALVDAESAVADARSAAGDAARDAADAERQAQQRIADAQERVTDARGSAARAAEQAAERVARAEDQLADAQGRAREAQEGLNEARREAARALKDMREQLSDLALAEEGAEIGLIEARRRLSEVQGQASDISAARRELAQAAQRLAEVEADSSATRSERHRASVQVAEATFRLSQAEEAGTDIALERRKAELGVAQAEDQLSDVRRDQTEATKQLNEAERRGISGSEQVVAAKERITEANEAVRDAQEGVRDAIEDERRTQEDSAEAIRDAIAGVDEARRNAARTAEDSAARIADAARRVREAEEAANRVREQVRLRMLDIADAAEAEALALFEETGSQDDATEALERGRKKLIDVGIEYGLTRGKAEDYADQIIGTPTEWTTLFKQRGLDNVKDKVQKLADKIIELEDRTITITANGSVLVDGKRSGGRLAQGGPINGPGTPTSDSIPVWASDGEYMMNAAARRKYGDDVMDAINSGQLAIGGPGSNTVSVRGKDGINAADFGLMAARVAGMAAEAGFSSGKVLPPGQYRIGRGTAGHGYPALDLPAPVGTPIYSMAAGIVSRAMRLATSYGIHAFVDHPGERQSRYAHMSAMRVGLGDEVRKGQLLGRVGSTGNSIGPHLHFEALVNGLRRDPKQLGIFHRGGPTDDGLGLLKRGEFVVQAPAVQQLGPDAMKLINQGMLPGQAGGGHLTGNLYLETGEFMGVIRGEVRHGISESSRRLKSEVKAGKGRAR